MGMKTSTAIWVFLWSLFMGVTACSIGVGAAYPPLNYIAAPVVCPGGKMSVNSTVYNPYPGTTVTTEDWICTNTATGAQTPLSIFKISLVAGVVYGLLLFLLIVVLYPVAARRFLYRGQTDQSYAAEASSANQQANERRARDEEDLEQRVLGQIQQKERSGGASGSGNSESRLRELERLRTSNLITQAEYDRKRAEILNSI